MVNVNGECECGMVIVCDICFFHEMQIDVNTGILGCPLLIDVENWQNSPIRLAKSIDFGP